MVANLQLYVSQLCINDIMLVCFDIGLMSYSVSVDVLGSTNDLTAGESD